MRDEKRVVTDFVGSMLDVSSRVDADRALRQSEQRLQLALFGGSLGRPLGLVLEGRGLGRQRALDGALDANARRGRG